MCNFFKFYTYYMIIMSRIKISLILYLFQILIKIILIKTNKCVLITKVFVWGISITTQFLVGTLSIHLKLLLLIPIGMPPLLATHCSYWFSLTRHEWTPDIKNAKRKNPMLPPGFEPGSPGEKSRMPPTRRRLEYTYIQLIFERVER